MGLKQLIKEKAILASGAVNLELTLPGEPLIYSIKYVLNNRKHTVNFFRDMKWSSLLKCYFKAQLYTKTPVVILIKFYVSPPSYITVKDSDLKRENVPAVRSFELCEYILSFMEMLHHVLINSYRQIVKIDAEKYYSNNPRTVFKFMKWDHYVELQNKNTPQPQGQSFCAGG